MHHSNLVLLLYDSNESYHKTILKFNEFCKTQAIIIDKIYAISPNNIFTDVLVEVLTHICQENNYMLEYKCIPKISNKGFLQSIKNIFIQHHKSWFFIEPSTLFNFDETLIDWKAIHVPQYIPYNVDKSLFYKLFYIRSHLNLNDAYFTKYYSIDTAELNTCIKLVNNIPNEYNYIVEHPEHFDHCDKLLAYMILQKYDTILAYKYKQTSDNSQDIKWLILYSKATACFNLDNYVLCKDYCNKCIELDHLRHEPYILLAKIYYNNCNYIETADILSNYRLANSNDGKTIYTNIEVDLFEGTYLNILANDRLKNFNVSIDSSMNAIDSDTSIDNKSMLIKYLLNRLSLIENSDYDIPYKYTELEYNTIIDYKFILPDRVVNMFTNRDSKEVYLQDGEKELSLLSNDITTLSGLYLGDDEFVIVSSLCPFIINSIKSNKLEKYKEYDTPEYWNNYNIATKFIKYKNVYIALVTTRIEHEHENESTLIKICYLNSETLCPMGLSKFIKVRIISVKDIFIEDDDLIIIGNNRNTSISLTKLYLEYDIPIDYSPTMYINIKNDFEIDMKCIGYDLHTFNYNNITIGNNNPLTSIIYNAHTNVITNVNTGFSQLIDKFIYLPSNIDNCTKTHDIMFYSSSTDVELHEYLKRYDITYGENYSICKYIIIRHTELENLSSLQLSDIIANKTLVISLLDDTDMAEDISAKYKDDPVLHKLFLFNIFKNSEYMEFIYQKIFCDDQYNIREPYFNIDTENIYENNNIYDTALQFYKIENEYTSRIDDAVSKDEYKIDILTRLHSKTENTILLELLKFILYHSQDILIFYESELPSLVVNLNIIGEIYKLSNIDITNYMYTTCVIIVDTFSNISNWRDVYDSESIIYVLDQNKLIYAC